MADTPATADGGPPWLVAATYNIHSCVGSDGRCDPARVADVIAEIDPDIIGLQEVQFASWDGGGQLEALAKRTGLHPVPAPLQDKTGDVHGLGLLSRFEPVVVTCHDSSVSGREPRGILEVHMETEYGALRALVTHFGLRAAERRHQSRVLLQRARAGNGTPTLVLGDINEWRPGSRALARLCVELGDPPAPRSFPATFPVLRLDRIWMVSDSSADVVAHRSALARLASDHLPVVARVRRDLLVSK